MNEVTYIDHCDDGSCDLGSAEFNCPNCNKVNIQYGDLWWRRDDIYTGFTLKLKCDNCKCDLEAYYNKDKYEIKIKIEIKNE